MVPVQHPEHATEVAQSSCRGSQSKLLEGACFHGGFCGAFSDGFSGWFSGGFCGGFFGGFCGHWRIFRWIFRWIFWWILFGSAGGFCLRASQAHVKSRICKIFSKTSARNSTHVLTACGLLLFSGCTGLARRSHAPKPSNLGQTPRAPHRGPQTT